MLSHRHKIRNIIKPSLKVHIIFLMAGSYAPIVFRLGNKSYYKTTALAT